MLALSFSTSQTTFKSCHHILVSYCLLLSIRQLHKNTSMWGVADSTSHWVFYSFCCTPWGLPRWWYLGCCTESSRNLNMTSPCWELLSLSPYDRSSQSFVDLRSRHLAGFITVNTEQILIAQWEMQSCGVWLNWSCGEWFCFIFLE